MEIIFANDTHKANYEAFVKKSGYDDAETKAALYLIALIDKPQRVQEMFDFKRHEIKPDTVAADWHYSTSRRAFKLACHLWNNCNPCQICDTFGTEWDRYFLQAIKIRFGI